MTSQDGQVVLSKEYVRQGSNTLLFSAMGNEPVSISGIEVAVSSGAATPERVLERASSADFAVLEVASGYSYALERSQTASIPVSLSNVTRGATAYRNRNGANAVRVRIGVNRTLGVSKLREAKVMYFDYGQKSWLEAPVRNVDHAAFMIEAEVPGGTDYFAALIKTPEMPEASAFMPTAISDLEPKSPAEGITLIQPPTANQQGDANISYPLTIPQGRQGMTPQLALSYNSSGGDSWCGFGWNISMPSVSVDTRWGVPRYSNTIETEVYTLNGESLHEEGGLKANRPQLVGGSPEYPSRNQSGTKQFFPRIQGSYQKIERKGNTTDGYFWVITDANQTKQYFGTRNGTSLDTNSVLRDPASGNIAQWFITRTVDKWGNFIDYTYSHQYPGPSKGLRQDGVSMYPKSITYTGNGSTQGNYKVKFVHADLVNSVQRGKISMNNGFKVVDDRLLQSVEVYYQSTLIREFKPEYGYGDFHKALLLSVSEYRNGSKFYSHSFNYNKYGPDEFMMFGPAQTVANNPNDNTILDQIQWSYLRNKLHKLLTPSLIKTTSTSGWSTGGALGLGLSPEFIPLPDKTFTLSGKLNYSESYSRDKYSLQDMNADGIPDLVFDKRYSNQKAYYPLSYQTGQLTIGGEHRINASRLFSNKSSSVSTGYDFVLPLSIYSYGKNWNFSTSYSKRYLTDYNGDGVMDQVVPTSNGGAEVHFGNLSDEGTLSFDSNSSNSISPVVKGEPAVSYTDGDLKEFEVVRTWTAPADGDVTIDSDPQMYTGVSGQVQVSIQHNNVFIQAPVTIPGSGLFNQTQSVTKGDILMFRATANGSGIGDWMQWNPSVTFATPLPTDGNGTNYSSSSSSDGFILSGAQGVIFKGSDLIKVNLNHAGTGFSDDVFYKVTVTSRNAATSAVTRQVFSSKKLQGSGALQVNTQNFFTGFAAVPNVSATDECQLTIEAFANSNVHWHNVSFRPSVEIQTNCSSNPLVSYPVVGLGSYNFIHDLNGSTGLSLPSGSYNAIPDIYHDPGALDFVFDGAQGGVEQPVYVVVKSGNQTIGKRAVVLSNSMSSLGNAITHFSIKSNDGQVGSQIGSSYSSDPEAVFSNGEIINNEVHIEFYADQSAYAEKAIAYVRAHLIEVQIQNLGAQTVALKSNSNCNFFYRKMDVLGSHYKGWGQFVWNEDHNTEILTSQLELPGMHEAQNQQSPLESSDDFTGYSNLSPWEAPFSMMVPVRGENAPVAREYVETTCGTSPEKDHWSIFGSFMGVYRYSGNTATGQFGEDTPDADAVAASSSPYSVPACFNVTKSKSLTVSIGGGNPIVGTSNATSVLDDTKYFSHTWTSFQDLNGDGFSDMIYNNGSDIMVQYTNPGGDHGSVVPLLVGTVLNKSISDDFGISSNGSYPNDDLRFMKQKVSLSGSTSQNFGTSTEKIELFDFNGDGLVDRITHNGTNQLISLNNGYGFDAPIAYNDTYNLSYSRGRNESTSLGASVGTELEKLNKGNDKLSNSFSVGVSINNVGSNSKSLPLDLNGDGLTDLIVASSTSAQIYINDGLNFYLYGSVSIPETPNNVQGFGISGNVGATVSFPLFLAVKLSISANGGGNYAINKMRSSFMDMNGDGAVDFLQAEEDGDLTVRYSDVEKSNLLISVTNPLGGSFTVDYELVGHKTGVHDPIVKTDKGNDVVLWDMPSGKWVMSKVTINDGYSIFANGIDYDGEDATTLFFDYDGGIQGRREKSFDGFTRIQTRHQNQLGSESTYPKRYLTETVEYFAPTKMDFEARNKHEYLKGLVNNNYSLLHEKPSSNSAETVTVLSRQTSNYEFRIVTTSGTNKGTVGSIGGNWLVMDWANKQETQTVFPAVVSTEAVNYPDKEDANNYHSQLFELTYDKYFNVTRYQDKGFMTPGSPTLDTVDVIIDKYFKFYYQDNQCNLLGAPDLFDGVAHGYIITCEDTSFDNDTIWTVPSTSDCTTDLFSLGSCDDGADMFSSQHKKLVIDTNYVTQLKLNAQYSSSRIAVMTYETPGASVANRTNVLKKHEIYLGSVISPNILRSSEVVSFTTGGEAMSRYKVLLNNSQDFAISDLSYDTYGNITSVIGAENHQGQRASSSFTYDPTDHQFISTVTNQFGETVCSVYDHNSGNLLQTVGINGHGMSYKYDKYDRIVSVFAPRELNTPNSPATIEYKYYFGNGIYPVALTIHNNEFDVSDPAYMPSLTTCTYQAIDRPAIPAGAPTTATFTDGNGQAIQVKSYKKNNSGTDGFVVSGFQAMNKFGKPVTTYEDFLSTSSATTFALPASALDKVVKDVQYDYQYRQISADNYVAYATGGFGQWVTSTVEYGFDNLLGTTQPEFYTRSTTLSNSASTNPTPNVSSSEYVDARGRKIGVVQHAANELVTKFQYNAIGELLTVIDPIGAATYYTYDLAGRQLSENQPDRGLSTLTYDKASNVIEMTNPATDAQNDAIHLSYDYNRLRFKTMPAVGGAVDLYNVEYIYGHYGDGNNGAGRVVTIKQGGTFKVDDYKYDELGQMAQEVKTFDVPNVGPRTFATSYRYDSFGRILKSIYPDGDQVTYSYYPSGELSQVSSNANGIVQSIISEIYYDGRGNISALHYGNGTHTTYDYADRTWTLMGSTVTGLPSGGTTPVSLLDRNYEYNSLGGINSIERNMHTSLVQGGETQHTFNFTYDAFNRLLDGSMTMNNVSGTAYQVATAFNDAGGIISKTSLVNTASSTLSGNASTMDYNLDYNYNEAKPHQLESVFDQVSGNTQQFVYNESGSIKQIQDNTQNQEFYWNEDQWLNAVQNNQGIHHYVYDDKGERIMKSSVIQSNVYVNDQVVNTIQDLEPYTLYVNPYFVITEFSNADKVSKHYFMGTQRVASELAVQTTSYSPLVSHSGSTGSASFNTESYKTQANTGSTLNQGLESAFPEGSYNPWLNNLNDALANFGEDQLTLEETQKDLPTIESIYPELSLTTSYKTTTTIRMIYWYHPDYIGNVDLVSDNSGEAYEFFLYSPWGENLYEWNSGTASFSSPYRFNGKELDQETGLFYYGARYHEPKLSLWLSVDPLTAKTNEPYVYIGNNPVIKIDPNGENPFIIIGAISGALFEMGSQMATNMQDDGSFSKAFKKMDWADVGISAASGALAVAVPGAGLSTKLASRVLLASDVVSGTLKAAVDFSDEDGLQTAGFSLAGVTTEKKAQNFKEDIIANALGVVSSQAWSAVAKFAKYEPAPMSVDGVISRGISNMWSTTSSIFSKSYSISNRIYGTTKLEEVNIVFDKSTNKALNAEEIIKNVTDQVNDQQSLNQ
jgi:RHS repeat-associated protein